MDWKIESKWLMPALFLLFVATYGIFFYITNPVNLPAADLNGAINDGCVLEYGKSECIEGKLNVPFYNSGAKIIVSAEITIPKKNGIDIASITSQLQPQNTGSVKLTDCGAIDSSRPLKLKWCCEKCYETEMNNPSDSVELEKN
ncbi:MAG: hypothetical protein NT067_05440 [Candidatus Diapherotrites archaeon]|nr:hypothetical protein [Candidatus Diapherotrites archaeon]